MKTLTILLLLLMYTMPDMLMAQSYKHIDVNNIDARIYSSGDLFWDLEASPKYEVPKGSGTHVMFGAAPWIGGWDDNENLYVAAQTYRQTGTDYQPGPLSVEGGEVHESVVAEYDYVWKVSREDIDAFLAGEDTTEDILSWPAHGNSAYSLSENLAPFVDVSGTGKYEPDNGDYPEIKGDMALWWVFNDHVEVNQSNSGTERMLIEVHGMAFGFKNQSEVVENTLFFEYTIINRSLNTYKDVYFGKWADFNIGFAYNNYIGSYPEINTIFSYVAEDFDPSPIGYGENPPAQSLTFFNQDLAFLSYYNNNNFAQNGNPELSIHYYNYLSGLWKDDTYMCWGGNAFDTCWDPDSTINFIYPHDPGLPRGDGEFWSEESAGNAPGDRRGIGSVGPVEFAPGESISLSMGYTFHHGGTRLENASAVQENVAKLKEFYDNEVATFIKESNNESALDKKLSVYPNPAKNILQIQSTNFTLRNAELIDLTGQTVRFSGSLNDSLYEMNLEGLPRGIYVVKVESDGETFTRRVMVE